MIEKELLPICLTHNQTLIMSDEEQCLFECQICNQKVNIPKLICSHCGSAIYINLPNKQIICTNMSCPSYHFERNGVYNRLFYGNDVIIHLEKIDNTYIEKLTLFSIHKDIYEKLINLIKPKLK